MAIRIFQLAKQLKIESREILDALDDMGIPAKSNLQALDPELVEELRGLFKPKPKVAKKTAKPAPEEVLRKSEEEAARRETARKEAARQAALKRAAAKKAELKRLAEEQAAQRVARRKALEAPQVPDVSEILPTPPPEEPAAPAESPALAAAAAPEAPAAVPLAPSPEAPPAVPATPPPGIPAGPVGLGKAVIAPPPTTARERERLLGRPIAPSRPTRTPPAHPGARPGGMGIPGPPRPSVGPRPGKGKRKRKKGERVRLAERHLPSVHATAREPKVEEPVGEVIISEGMTIKDLSERIKRKSRDVIKQLLVGRGIMATINQALDSETASWVVEEFGGTIKLVSMEEAAIVETVEAVVAEGRTQPRSPVVTFMGHVDHGKTSLLDAIRSTRVAAREAGGITQHVGAYVVEKEREGVRHQVVFLDTPGHEAFTLMRARGARVTDIVVLVVAADDGVMPQTQEAINHAKAAGVPLIVAINKIDKPGADPDRIKQQLTEHELLVEDYGGDVVSVPVSAKTQEGLDHLLEMILLVAELQDLKASPDKLATGSVLEARKDKARGPIATILVQNGTLKPGDPFVVGAVNGKVRALLDEDFVPVLSAGPSTPVVVLGLEDVPAAGDQFQVIPDEARARQIVQYRQAKLREEAMVQTARRSLEHLHEAIRDGETLDLPIILKADVAGSVEALSQALLDLSTDEVKVRIVHSATGAITESDVLLGTTTNAIVIGFNVRPERGVAGLAKKEGVDVRLHTVIYTATDEIKQAMLGRLAPTLKEKFLGRAEVRDTFSVPKVGVIAGCYVTDGLVTRDAQTRLLRDNVVVHEGKVASLRRFKDDVREVKAGYECGIGLERYQDIKIGDEIEFFTLEKVARSSLEPGEKATGA